ncbi:actin interacting protein 3-domain-containing protein [Lactarius akahatsu]|uniref:Actin interacting protein 3-domain-containing protein n=1 Tax=Lactarius akahatsu TaxID=416441 RepID=A0AAD4QB53_9AGAM|nr:actin interacting protein 3-domain-containing protein [Lactarius akahatsu]
MAVKQPLPPSASTQSSPSRSEIARSVTSTKSRSTPVVESAVTRLLVSIKQLLESLTQWSISKASEEEVSDVYVRLGNDFNTAVSAFAFYEIDMSELLGFPDELRGVLEECLSEEASSTTLDRYLPQVRNIVTNLLKGLRGKQHTFRQIVSNNRPKSEASGHTRSDSGQMSRSSRTHARRDTQTSIASTDDGFSRRNTQSSVGSSRRKESGTYDPLSNGDAHFIGGFGFPAPMPQPQHHSGRSSRLPSDPRPPSAPAHGLPPPYTPPPQNVPLPEPDPDPEGTPVPPFRASAPQVPANVKRYSLVDKPAQPPSVVVDDSSSQSPTEPDRSSTQSPPPELPAVENLTANPGVASSLAALKKSDLLERRASKRFSTYNISKMTGVPRGRSELGVGHPNRRSLVAGGGGTLTANELTALTEADEENEVPPAIPLQSPRRQRSISRTRGPPPSEIVEERPPVPPLPRAVPTAPLPPTPKLVESSSSTPAPKPVPSAPGTPDSINVFLQVGREVKKARMEPGLTFSSLRMLFVDKFAYNPGQEDFPAIYIRDPSSGVQYELEDTDEVKDKCLLSLNIEPLDQIKKHIDVQISSLAQELRDLRKTVGENRRSTILVPPVIDETSVVELPTDSQLQKVARRLSRLVQREGTPTHSDASVFGTPLMPQETGQSLLLQPQMTGSSVMSEYSLRIVSDLRTQVDEVQNLRRDLGIMRQLYTEFMKQTKATLTGLRTQTQAVRQMASTQVPGARSYIDAGKTKLDARSQNVLTKMEELQDTVEGVKDDVLKRHISPKPQVLRAIKEDLSTVGAELQSLTEHISTVKPMWKKTWEEELQSIVEEQQFLNHQEEFLADLIEDRKAVTEVYGHVEKVISLRGASGARGARGRALKTPTVDKEQQQPGGGGGGLSSVMLEIRGATVDPERRLKAIEASQKNRERELADRADEFEEELKGFVGGKKLKMTGGAEEAERVRQAKNDLSLKAMFGAAPAPLVSAPAGRASPGQ